LIPVLALVAVLALGLVVYFGKATMSKAASKADQATEVMPGAIAPSLRQQQQGAQAPAPMTAAELISSYQPRIGGLPHTAPRYDALTAPVHAPRAAACLQMQDRCECYTQQGTKLAQVEPAICQSIVKHGYFQDWQDDAV